MASELSTAVSRPYLPPTGGPLVAEVTVDPGRQTTPVTRQVALVVDVSGSMSGAKLEQVKRGTELVLGGLDDEDSLAVVAFADEPTVVLEATPFGEVGHDAVAERVAGLSAGGGTDIAAALERARDELAGLPDGEDVARRLLLLSDGKDSHRPASAFESVARAVDEAGARIEAAGIGEEYDEATIRTLGTTARGRWRHIDEADEIAAFFGDAVREMGTVVGSDAELRLGLADGVEVREAYRAAPQVQEATVDRAGGERVVRLPDLHDRERQRVILTLAAPGGTGEATLADLRLRARGATAEGRVAVEYTDDEALLATENTDVLLDHDETRVRTALGRGDVETAVERTTRVREKHGAAAAETVAELDAEVTRVREGGRAERADTTVVDDDPRRG
jgi:Ca-activated chloride channel family protein